MQMNESNFGEEHSKKMKSAISFWLIFSTRTDENGEKKNARAIRFFFARSFQFHADNMERER